MRDRKWVLFATILGAAGILLAWGSAAGAAEPVKIGLPLPLTGIHAKFGEAIRNAYVLALDEINAAGGIRKGPMQGRKIEFILEDTTSKPEVARSAVEKLIARDKVPMIVGEYSSSNVFAVAGVTNKFEVPYLSQTGAADNITEQGWKWIYRINQPASEYAGGLQDFSISRAGQPWGISIPWDPDQVAYVWADALVNYLSALTYARPGEDLRARFWPSARHLIGKDIIRFHCVFWPAMLLSAGYAVPHQLFVHGYLLLDDRKISKSLGNVVDPLDLIDVYGADAVRFWSTRAVSFGQDGSVSIESLHERYERELANDLGNLVSRTTAMIARFLDGDLPARASDDSPIRALVGDIGDDVAARLDVYDLTGALERIWEAVRGLNRHVEASAPWKLAENGSRREELEQTLYDLADGLRVVAIALAPYLPDTSPRILEALGCEAELDWDRVAYGLTPALTGVTPTVPLFPRIDAPTTAA